MSGKFLKMQFSTKLDKPVCMCADGRIEKLNSGKKRQKWGGGIG